MSPTSYRIPLPDSERISGIETSKHRQSGAALVGTSRNTKPRPFLRLRHSRAILFLLAALIATCCFINVSVYRVPTLAQKNESEKKNFVLPSPARSSSSSFSITENAMQELFDLSGKSPPDILSRNPKRIPGYIYGSSQTFFGFVFRDLLTRICSRHIAQQAHVLVLAPEAAKLAHRVQSGVSQSSIAEEELRVQMNHSVAGSTLLHAFRQGHAITGLEPTSPFHDLPSWTLFALVDAGFDTRAVFERATGWLSNTTITYIVLGVGADPGGQTFGREAAEVLTARKYKVQLLSLSHFDSVLRPNILLQEEDTGEPMKATSSIASIEFFFQTLRATAKRAKAHVRGYLFCTQGFDLAIPAATEYVLGVKPGHIEYRSCSSTDVGLKFVRRDGSTRLVATCRGIPALQVKDVWANHNNDIPSSEAACARVFCEARWISTCVSRILTPQLELTPGEKDVKKKRPNLLVLMMDPISRSRFERSLPKTSRLLQRLNFLSFSNYTAVGNSSGPNQAALYSGYPLHSRDTIAKHLLEDGSNSTMKQWLWDSLRDEGYATFKAEDGCIENSNMMQSIRPQTHHGEALTHMMCYEFQRPNCVGHKSAAEHMTEHFQSFVRTYLKMGRPWAGFLHFIDSHEDTMSMEGTLDTLLWKFLYSFYEQRQSKIRGDIWNNTLILLLSDHGLHYGSYLLSPEGRRERSQPILHMHLPSGTSNAQESDSVANAELYTTPFDVYQTILHVSRGERQHHGFGHSLLDPLPKRRETCLNTLEIPRGLCSILDSTSKPGRNVMMPYPPSVLSFYADIPMENKETQPQCSISTAGNFSTAPVRQCICASNIKAWHNCTMPSTRVGLRSETFRLADCNGHRSFNIDVQRNPTVLGRRAIRESRSRKAKVFRPNILFLELDSVSFAYADRHFPKTRELLEIHRIKKTGEGYKCNEGLCSAEFPFFSVTGSNSIPNQISAFGGCVVLTGAERCMSTSVLGSDTMCADNSSIVNQMYLVNTFRHNTQTWCRVGTKNGSPSPWIFDIANMAGYVTLFSEEFCYDDSIYVTQNNIFPLNVDILPHKMFCREVERKALLQGVKIRGPIWRFEVAGSDSACIAGPGSIPKVQVSLEHIEKMWDAYADTPKLAYVNAMAAHQYSAYRTMSSAAEAYDTALASFLGGMLKRADANNTLIVVRGDHGLQGGSNVADYAVQVEALRPWTEIILPEHFPTLSLSTLMENQNRLATGSDLYRTLTESIVAGNRTLMPPPSAWTMNLLRQRIPQHRTCADAKVPLHYCLFENERTSCSPNLATCNPQELRQELACAPVAGEFLDHMATEVEQEFVAKRIESQACRSQPDNRTEDQPYLSVWSAIDATVESFPGSKVSGGIFLYPRQTELLFTIVQLQSEMVLEREHRPFTVCETGFGAGHSAALFLSTTNHTHVNTFDLFDRPYQLPALQQLKSRYGGRIVDHMGSSCESVPKYLTAATPSSADSTVRCDLLHGSSLCPTDNIDLVENSPCGVILTSTAMKSLKDNAVYFGPKGQWTGLQERQCISDITCFAEEERELDRNFVFNRDGARITHKFCMAITTGRCTNATKVTNPERKCETSMARISRNFNLSRFCPAYQRFDSSIKT